MVPLLEKIAKRKSSGVHSAVHTPGEAQPHLLVLEPTRKHRSE